LGLEIEVGMEMEENTESRKMKVYNQSNSGRSNSWLRGTRRLLD
jgi:hypothetical protein